MTAIKKYLIALTKGCVHFSVHGLNLKVQYYTSITAVLRAVRYCGTDCFCVVTWRLLYLFQSVDEIPSATHQKKAAPLSLSLGHEEERPLE